MDLGITEEGWEIGWQLAAEGIENTDAYADQLIDGVFRGLRNVSIQCNAIEWKTGPAQAVTPFQVLATTGASYLGPGIIARLMSAIAGSVILTSTTGTPAVATPASLTATYAHLARNFDVRLLFHSKLRKVPIRFELLAYDAGSGVIKFLTVT